MKKLNPFYSTYKNSEDQKEFKIRELEPMTFRGMDVAFSDGKGNISGGGSIDSPTTSRDYDDEFVKEILKFDPPYHLEEFLTYHYNEYQKEVGANPSLFLKHMQYVILERIKFIQSPHKEIAANWINQEQIRLQDNGSPEDYFSERDKILIFKRLDELLERICKLEVGQQIIYDDLVGEFIELKQLSHKLKKKNWHEVVKGKLVSIGLGHLTDEGFKMITSVFSENKLIE